MITLIKFGICKSDSQINSEHTRQNKNGNLGLRTKTHQKISVEEYIYIRDNIYSDGDRCFGLLLFYSTSTI